MTILQMQKSKGFLKIPQKLKLKQEPKYFNSSMTVHFILVNNDSIFTSYLR